MKQANNMNANIGLFQRFSGAATWFPRLCPEDVVDDLCNI